MSVYYIQAGDDGPIKIGHADDPWKRLSQVQVGHSEPLRIIAVAQGGAAEEKQTHEKFSEDRIRGEWFRPSAQLIAHIGNIRYRRAGHHAFYVTIQEFNADVEEAAADIFYAYWSYRLYSEPPKRAISFVAKELGPETYFELVDATPVQWSPYDKAVSFLQRAKAEADARYIDAFDDIDIEDLI